MTYTWYFFTSKSKFRFFFLSFNTRGIEMSWSHETLLFYFFVVVIERPTDRPTTTRTSTQVERELTWSSSFESIYQSTRYFSLFKVYLRHKNHFYIHRPTFLFSSSSNLQLIFFFIEYDPNDILSFTHLSRTLKKFVLHSS